MTKKSEPSAPPPVPADTETSRTIIVRLSTRTHKALRIRVAQEDTSIQKWVERLIERELALCGPIPDVAPAGQKVVKSRTTR